MARSSASRAAWLWLGSGASDERSNAAAGFERTGSLEMRVDPRHGVGVDAKGDSELSNGRELVAWPKTTGPDGHANAAFQLRVERGGVLGVDGACPVPISHCKAIVLVY
jgi:hypothetical protein